MTSYFILKTAVVGDLLLMASEAHLAGIYFADCAHAPVVRRDWVEDRRQGVIERAVGQLREYLEGERTSFSLPLGVEGTEFQRETWRQIARIPFGETMTYSRLAEKAGAATAIRAAGTATGRNPLSIVVPCHRVVGKNGGLGGYAGGLERKMRLLELERKALRRVGLPGRAVQAGFALSA